MEPTHDERNMAALAQSLGILAALPVWLRWRNRSAFVRAHAAQSIAFDGITLAALVIVAALIIGGILAGNVAFSKVNSSNADVALFFLVAICAPALTLIGFLAVMLVALVLRLRAAMAANQGKLFQYPLLKNKTFEIPEISKV